MSHPDKKGSTFKALPISPPPIWNGIVIISADCCVNGALIAAGTVMQVGPLPTRDCPYCTSDNEAIRTTYYDQTCPHCVTRMSAKEPEC